MKLPDLPPLPDALHMGEGANITLPDGTVTADTAGDHRLFEPVDMVMYATAYGRACARAALEQAIDECREAWPRAHTYASENADLYRAQDHVRDKLIHAILRMAKEIGE